MRKHSFKHLTSAMAIVCMLALVACGNGGRTGGAQAGTQAEVETYTVATNSLNMSNGCPATIKGIATNDESQVYAYFSLNEKQIVELTQNGSRSLEDAIAQLQPVQLRLNDGSIYAQTGKVSTVPGDDPLRALFPNSDGALHNGDMVEILLPSDSQNVIMVPQKATFEADGQLYVYIVNDSSMAVAQPITVLPENDGTNYVVTNGLKQGDVIVTEGVGTLVQNGTAVVPKEAAN